MGLLDGRAASGGREARVRIAARLAAHANEVPLAVKGPNPTEVRFHDFERKPDEW